MRIFQAYVACLVTIGMMACRPGDDAENEALQSSADTSDPVAVTMGVEANEQVFAADVGAGYCYRIPSIVRAGSYLVAIAEKRFGDSGAAKNAFALWDKADDGSRTIQPKAIEPCADESTQSLVMKVAPIAMAKNAKAHDWSNEITLMDHETFERQVMNPGSALFRPDLYDYVLRLSNGAFSDTNSDYANFLKTHYGLKNDKQLKDWLSDPVNAYGLIPLRFGAQSAIGNDDKATLTIAAVLAAPLTPFGVSNAELDEPGMMTIVAGKFDVQALVDAANKGPYTVPFTGKNAPTWNFDVGSDHALDCLAKHVPDGIDPNGYVDDYIAKSGMKLPTGVATLADLRQLVTYYQTAQRTDFAVGVKAKDFPPLVRADLWRAAVQDAISRADQIGWKAPSSTTAKQLSDLTTTSDWDIAASFALLGIAPSIAATSSGSVAMLGLIRGVYLRMLNDRVTNTAIALKNADTTSAHQLVTLLFQEIGLGFEKETRVGPGNGVALANGKLFFPVANNPLVLGTALGNATCMDGRAIIEGSERQGVSLGLTDANPDHEVLLMSMRRKHMPPKDGNGIVDLSKWTRTFSVSWSGAPWQDELAWGPQYASPKVDTNAVAAMKQKDFTNWVASIDGTPGFKDTQVQGTVVALKDFYGAGKNLIVHGHPQNVIRGMQDGKPDFTDDPNGFAIRSCVGSDPGDATKDGKRCDFRSHYTLIPGRPNLNPPAAHPENVMAWSFAKGLQLTTYGSGYSAIASVDDPTCGKGTLAALVETATHDTKVEYRGYNDSIRLFTVTATGPTNGCK